MSAEDSLPYNPGNVAQQAGVSWQGIDKPVSPGTLVDFLAPHWGIRAIARNLIKLQDARRANHAQRIAEALAVAEPWRLHIGPELDLVGRLAMLDVYDFGTLNSLVRRIIVGELGRQPYSDAVINRALLTAGVEPVDAPDPDLPVWRTWLGTILATLGITSLSGCAVALAELVGILQPFSGIDIIRQVSPWIGLAAAALGWIEARRNKARQVPG